MDKRSIAVLVVAAMLYLGGLTVGLMGKGEAERINYPQQRYTFSPPYVDATEARVARMIRVPSVTTPLGLVAGAGGALWLVVSVLQANKIGRSHGKAESE